MLRVRYDGYHATTTPCQKLIVKDRLCTPDSPRRRRPRRSGALQVPGGDLIVIIAVHNLRSEALVGSSGPLSEVVVSGSSGDMDNNETR